MDLYKSLIDWLKVVCPFSDWVYFNAIRMEVGSNTVVTVPGNSYTQEYIDGSSYNELIFAISLVRLYSAEMSDDNMTAMEEVSQIVNAINDATDLPLLGIGLTADDVEIVQDIPSVNIDQDANICEYQIQAKLCYYKKA